MYECNAQTEIADKMPCMDDGYDQENAQGFLDGEPHGTHGPLRGAIANTVVLLPISSMHHSNCLWRCCSCQAPNEKYMPGFLMESEAHADAFYCTGEAEETDDYGSAHSSNVCWKLFDFSQVEDYMPEQEAAMGHEPQHVTDGIPPDPKHLTPAQIAGADTMLSVLTSLGADMERNNEGNPGVLQSH